MDSFILSTLKIDKTALSLVPNFYTADEKAYWLSRTPSERLQHMAQGGRHEHQNTRHD